MTAAVFGDTLFDVLKSVHVLCTALWVGLLLLWSVVVVMVVRPT